LLAAFILTHHSTVKENAHKKIARNSLAVFLLKIDKQKREY